MANFFKAYHTQLKADRAEQQAAKELPATPEYDLGQIVYINPLMGENRNGKRYFVDYLGDKHILLAKTKKEAMSGRGYIYSIYDIVEKKGA